MNSEEVSTKNITNKTKGMSAKGCIPEAKPKERRIILITIVEISTKIERTKINIPTVLDRNCIFNIFIILQYIYYIFMSIIDFLLQYLIYFTNCPYIVTRECTSKIACYTC